MSKWVVETSFLRVLCEEGGVYESALKVKNSLHIQAPEALYIWIMDCYLKHGQNEELKHNWLLGALCDIIKL